MIQAFSLAVWTIEKLWKPIKIIAFVSTIAGQRERQRVCVCVCMCVCDGVCGRKREKERESDCKYGESC